MLAFINYLRNTEAILLSALGTQQESEICDKTKSSQKGVRLFSLTPELFSSPNGVGNSKANVTVPFLFTRERAERRRGKERLKKRPRQPILSPFTLLILSPFWQDLHRTRALNALPVPLLSESPALEPQ